MPYLVNAIPGSCYEPGWQSRFPFRYWRLWDATRKELEAPYCFQQNALFLGGAFQEATENWQQHCILGSFVAAMISFPVGSTTFLIRSQSQRGTLPKYL